jgi:hypothetical protein
MIREQEVHSVVQFRSDCTADSTPRTSISVQFRPARLLVLRIRGAELQRLGRGVRQRAKLCVRRLPEAQQHDVIVGLQRRAPGGVDLDLDPLDVGRQAEEVRREDVIGGRGLAARANFWGRGIGSLESGADLNSWVTVAFRTPRFARSARSIVAVECLENISLRVASASEYPILYMIVFFSKSDRAVIVSTAPSCEISIAGRSETITR